MPIRPVSLSEAQELLARGGIDVVDVRETREWGGGHLPGSRNVPLGDVQRDAASKVPRDDVLFVCAHGVRSLTAAVAAQRAGRERVYSLEGGTAAWAAAGLPLER